MSEQEHNDFTLPSNPTDRKKIKDALYEMAGALQFIDDKREYINDVATDLKDSFDLPKKVTTKLARTLHKGNYSDVTAETDTFTTLFEVLFNGATTNIIPMDDEDNNDGDDPE